MLTDYIAKQLGRAKYKILPDGTYFGKIPGLQGVWADAQTLEECRNGLQEVLEGWLLLKIQDRDPIPGFKIKAERRALVKRA